MLLKCFLSLYFCVSLSKQKLVRDLANGISYANFLCSENMRLNTSLLQQLKVQTSSDCCSKCLTHSDCISVNYDKNGNGKDEHECQLLATDKFTSAQQMTVDRSSQHFYVPVS